MRLLLSALLLLAATPTLAALNLYTDRPKDKLAPLVQEFELKTGQTINVIELPYAQLITQLETAQDADLIFVKDMVFLNDLAQKGWLKSMTSQQVKDTVHPTMRDPQGLWTAVTIRPRTIAYDPSRVNPAELSTYEDLASAKWAGRLCLRTSNSSYNQALVASLINRLGMTATSEVLKGWVANLAQPVFPNDTAVLEAIANGQCDLGIVNSYYLGALVAQRPAFPVKLFFANQLTTGVHVNGSGIGLAKTSSQPALAEKFIELLLSESSQLYLTNMQFDYPAKMGLTPTSHVKSWGEFRFDLLNWSVIGMSLNDAKSAMTGAGYQ